MDPRLILIPTDSHCALRTIGSPRENIVERAAGNASWILEDKGFDILRQWIPFNYGIAGSDTVIRVADKCSASVLNGLPCFLEDSAAAYHPSRAQT